MPPSERIARRTEREGGDPADAGEFVVEKILAKRFNPRRKQYEYLLKWEGYPQLVQPYVHNMVLSSRSGLGTYVCTGAFVSTKRQPRYC